MSIKKVLIGSTIALSLFIFGVASSPNSATTDKEIKGTSSESESKISQEPEVSKIASPILTATSLSLIFYFPNYNIS